MLAQTTNNIDLRIGHFLMDMSTPSVDMSAPSRMSRAILLSGSDTAVWLTDISFSPVQTPFDQVCINNL